MIQEDEVGRHRKRLAQILQKQRKRQNINTYMISLVLS